MEAVISIGRPGDVWDYIGGRFVSPEWLATQVWYRFEFVRPPISAYACESTTVSERRFGSLAEAEAYGEREARRLLATCTVLRVAII